MVALITGVEGGYLWQYIYYDNGDILWHCVGFAFRNSRSAKLICSRVSVSVQHTTCGKIYFFLREDIVG
jgi:hypothetical protein